MADIHVKISGAVGMFGEPLGEYLVDAAISTLEEGGRVVELVVTKVERRTVQLDSPAQVAENAITAMREMGDSAEPARAVEVVRAIDAAMAKAKVDDPEWVDLENVESSDDL